MVSCVGNSQLLAAGVHGYFPREREDGGGQGVSIQFDSHIMVLEQPLFSVVLEGGSSEKEELFSMAFTHQGEKQISPGSQHH